MEEFLFLGGYKSRGNPELAVDGGGSVQGQDSPQLGAHVSSLVTRKQRAPGIRPVPRDIGDGVMAVAVLTSSLGIQATAPRRPGRTFASSVGGLVLLLSRKGHRDMCKGQGLDVRQKLHIPKHSSATWRLFIVRYVRNFYQQVNAEQFK